jgi:hypothetical protein
MEDAAADLEDNGSLRTDIKRDFRDTTYMFLSWATIYLLGPL